MNSIQTTGFSPRTQRAVDTELAKCARASANIATAHEDGRISEHDRDERIARVEDWAMNRIAWITGQPRPAQRDKQPLDDPNAGVVA